MNKSQKKTLIAALICNAAVVLMEIVGVVLSIGRHGQNMFLFYTQDSNIFAGISSLIFCICAVSLLVRKAGYIVPKWVKILRYLSTCVLMVTFLVVVLILAPSIAGSSVEELSFSMVKELNVDHTFSIVEAYKIMMLYNSMLFHHFLCPVLSLISFVLFEREPECGLRVTLLAMIPTVVYAAVLIPLNIARVVTGPYPFLMVYNQSVTASILWCIGILGFAYLIALGVWALNRKRK